MQERGWSRQAPHFAYAVEHCAADADIDTLGRDRGGWIHATPADAVEPDLGPGMGISLADDQVAAQRVQFAALIAEHDA